jgi:hypothetical protein
MIWKMVLWTIICFVGFNLIVAKGGNNTLFTYATIISVIVGPTLGFLFFKVNQRKSVFK